MLPKRIACTTPAGVLINATCRAARGLLTSPAQSPTMSTATDSLYCLFCHEPIGDEPAIEPADFDGVAHMRCFFELGTKDHDL
jgi:hypothetical protein